MLKKLHIKNIIMVLIGSAVLAFGLYNIHSVSDITEGGVLGLTLLLHHHFGISPSVSGFVMNFLCYALGFFVLGKSFIVYSAVAGAGFSVFYAVFERFTPIFPDIANHPLAASVLGALFVGIGVGISVRYGGAPGGDDALSMSLEKLLKKVKIQWIYLVSDLIVLVLSLSYIEPRRIVYSLVTVIISGQLIGLMQNLGCKNFS